MLHPIILKIDAAHEDMQEQPRQHFGLSQAGHKCDRWLWLNFRWAAVEKFEGRILRLFRRGHNEESTIVADLKLAGLEIAKAGDDQIRVYAGSHVSGSLDGIIQSGVPEAPNKRHVLEIKTHGKKSFDDLERHGVKKSKPMHYAQMQSYMYLSGVDRALYVAVCKDNDHLYIERLRLDESEAIKIIERAKSIALSDRLPEPLSTDATWWECRFCAAHNFCHDTNLTKEVNCRTCTHSTATDKSTWVCERYGGEIPPEFQYEGCDSHVLHPDLVPWKLNQARSTQHEACFEIDGKFILNGDGEKSFRSSELVANAQACASVDAGIMEIRGRFDGKISG